MPAPGQLDRPVIVIGSGGHAAVLVDALRRSGAQIIGATDKIQDKAGQSVLGVPVLGDDAAIFAYRPDEILVANGVGTTRVSAKRKEIFERFHARAYRFATVAHPAAYVAADAVLGEGAQVMAGAVIQPRARIGANAIINTRASVDHDCVVGAHSHVAPGATLCGDVRIEDEAHVGAGATVLSQLTLGRRCCIAAGAVVIRDVAAGATVSGVPARPRPAGG